MKIIPHRGCWNKDIPANSLTALKKAFDYYDGAEFDIRDGLSDVVIAHDAFQKNAETLESFFKTLGKSEKMKFFAINIKADGLGKRLKELLELYEIKNYMCFDLSFPESVKYLQLGLKVADRVSDLEKNDVHSASSLVIDCFEEEIDLIPYSAMNIPVLLISPELHGRNEDEFRQQVRKLKFVNVMVCTDHPEKWKAP